MDQNKPKIEVPSDWNADKDYDYYNEVFGADSDNLFAEAMERVHSSSWELVWLIDAALRKFLRIEQTASMAICCMSPHAKLQLLRYILRTSAPSSIADRLCDDITQCEAVITLRDAILTKHLNFPEEVWLYELGNCSDWLATAAIELLESLHIELGFPQDWKPTPPDC